MTAPTLTPTTGGHFGIRGIDTGRGQRRRVQQYGVLPQNAAASRADIEQEGQEGLARGTHALHRDNRIAPRLHLEPKVREIVRALDPETLELVIVGQDHRQGVDLFGVDRQQRNGGVERLIQA